MALYTISDLHLSESVDKPMDVFGGVWNGYRDKIISGFASAGVADGDVVVLPGDLSWGISMEEALADFKMIESLPGKKLILKGNHDLWWQTMTKMRRFFDENDLKTIDFIQNNCFMYNDIALCGTRGWFFEEERGDGHDKKLALREAMRLEMSFKDALAHGASEIYCFLHYPPFYTGYRCSEISDLIEAYGVKRCFFGHLHGASHNLARQGVIDGIEYRLVSADFLGFRPMLLHE